MKTNKFLSKNLIFSSAATFLIGLCANTQITFNVIIDDLEIDHNHYSIEAFPNNEQADRFAIAGTRFNIDGSTDMHVGVIESSNNGFVWIWSEIIDASEDDRALDLTINPITNDIVLTGYITVNNVGKIYAGSFTETGAMLATQFYDDANNKAGAGTNIIYSHCSGNYILGGFLAQTFDIPLVGNEAILLELNTSLVPISSTSIINADRETAINDIVEIIGDCEYFVTGSVFDGSNNQAVLVGKFNDALALVNNLSFKSDPNGSSAPHFGASMYYDEEADEVFLLSNNANFANPQLTRISNASGAPSISEHVTLLIDPNGGHYPSGFYLDKSPEKIAAQLGLAQKDLISISGFHANGWVTPPGTSNYNGNSTMWMATIDKGSNFTLADGSVRVVPSMSFTSHGYLTSSGAPLFSTYSGSQPYIFTQEIGCIDDYSGNMTFASSASLNNTGFFSVDVFRTSTNSNSECNQHLLFEILDENYYHINVSSTTTDMAMYDAVPSTTHYPQLFPYCIPSLIVGNNNQNTQGRNANSSEGALNSLVTNDVDPNFEITALPNPFSDVLTINMNETFNSGNVQITNMLGEVVYQKDLSEETSVIKVNTNEFKSGIYVISYSNDKFQKSEKLIKL